MTTTFDDEAASLLAAGNVRIHWRTDQLTSARVRDVSGIFDVSWQRFKGWNCTCQADECAHVAAVLLITHRSLKSSL
jgi:hypothetical protein